MAGSVIVKVRTSLTGTSPLMQHNVQLADPDNPWSKQIAKIAAKKNRKTEEDRHELARLEFLGGLYVHEGTIVVPKMNVRRCFQEAAKATRKGKDITRAVNLTDPTQPNATLLFADQDKTPEELFTMDRYRDVTIVGVTSSRLPRCRSRFDPWGLTVDWYLISNLLDFDEFAEIVKMAGLVEGLGDNRINGYGRFEATVTLL